VQSNRGPGVGCIVILALLAGVLGGLAGGYFAGRTLAPKPAALPVSSAAPVALPKALGVRSEDDLVVQAVKRANPSVVKVTSREQGDTQLSAWLGLPPQIVEGIGSGFIFQYEDGKQYVLTNTHVVGGATQILIKLTDGTTIQGTLAGADKQKDIAVVGLVNPPSGLVSATLGDASKLETGERVIAIGNPFDFEHTVTVGYVSALGNRRIGKGGPWRNVIQTDAAINEGNSGGPLVNLAGEVVGINSMIYSPSGAGNIGLGFAIPINDAKEMLYFLVNGGPWTGIAESMPNSPGFAAFNGLASSEGVVVLGVYPGSPAARAGIDVGDILLEADGQKLANSEDLSKATFAHRIGDSMAFHVNRAGKVYDVKLVTGKVAGAVFGG